jgi:thiosulfate dehydrogenase
MLPEDGREMRDILAYLDSLGQVPRPAGPDTVRLVGDRTAGRRVYTATCVRCHAANGAGVRALAPAVWGANSYSIGAGLSRQSMLATFVRWNMPFDHKDSLSDQQAADVAAFVLSKPRQDHPGKELDWPKGDAPKDAAYATTGARLAGKSLPPVRPLLPRRVSPVPRSSTSSR